MSTLLDDEAALRDLNARYCRGCDRRDFALVRSVYHPDATDDHGPMFSGGMEAFIPWLEQALDPFDMTSHSISNQLFAVDGDRAEGEIYISAYHRTKAPPRRELIFCGRYLDHYERRDGVWRILRRACIFERGEILEVDEAMLAELASQVSSGTADRDDRSWSMPLMAGLADRARRSVGEKA